MCKGKLKQQSFSLSTPNSFKHLLQRRGSPFWADTAPLCCKSWHFPADFFQLSAGAFLPSWGQWVMLGVGMTYRPSEQQFPGALWHSVLRLIFSGMCFFIGAGIWSQSWGWNYTGCNSKPRRAINCSVNYFILIPLGENKAELNDLAPCQAACWGFRTSHLGSEAKEFY